MLNNLLKIVVHTSMGGNIIKSYIYIRILVPTVLLLSLVTLFVFCTPYFSSQRWYIEQIVGKIPLIINQDYNTIETEHFIIKFLAGDQKQALEVAEESEKIYHPVTAIFHLQPKEKTYIVIDQHQSIIKKQFLAGSTKNGVIHIPNNSNLYVSMKSTTAHEFSHVMIRHKYNGAYNISPWIDEGLAFNIETSITGPKNKTNDDFDYESLYTIEKLEKLRSFLGHKNITSLYHQSSSIINYIIDNYGEDALFVTIDLISNEQKSFSEAAQLILQTDISALSNNSRIYFYDSFYIYGAFESTNFRINQI